MLINLGKHLELEINFSYWNPLHHISFKKSFDLWTKDDWEDEFFEPALWFNFSFFCINLEVFLCWYRREDEEKVDD